MALQHFGDHAGDYATWTLHLPRLEIEFTNILCFGEGDGWQETMENLYYLYNGRRQREANEQRKWAETFGPRKQDRIERAVQRRLEQFNLRGFILQGREEEIEEEELKQQGTLALGRWPWEYPKYDTSKPALRKWEGTKKFHDLMWDMQKIYEDKTWQLYKEREIGFTYRSQFEKSLNELPEELQALIISKVWNDGREGISAYVLGTTRHRGYHYKQEGLLYDLYVKKIFLPLYGGLNGRVGKQESD